jgi:transcriptional regulator with XRE-family HTH domain
VQVINLEKLARALKNKRANLGLTLDQVETETKVSPPTLSRLERNLREGSEKFVPDLNTLAKLAKWLGVSIASLLDPQEAPEKRDQPLPDVVEAYTRADKNLDPEDAKALTEIFKIYYEQAKKRTEDKKSQGENDENA